jgi:hypothetical protein
MKLELNKKLISALLKNVIFALTHLRVWDDDIIMINEILN